VLSDGEKARLQMLQETAKLELLHLQQTNHRLFAQAWPQEEMASKMLDIDFAERVDAFVARFGRLQDLLGDKYLPAWLRAVQEPVGTALENLDRAEKLGLVQSSDAWISVRKLRNQLVHEYVGRWIYCTTHCSKLTTKWVCWLLRLTSWLRERLSY